MDKKAKHMDFIQNVIDRQAKNSFLLKGWVITLIAGTFALSINEDIFKKSILVYFLIFIFWALDSYYLCQERKFRCLFENVRKLPDNKIDFNMTTNEIAKKAGCSWFETALSPTIFVFYLTLMLFTIFFLNWR